MEKISQIIPQSPRVQSVDLKNAQPIRPGAPSFGRPVGQSTGPGGDVVTTAQRAVAVHRSIMSARAQKEGQQVAIVDKMANQFFMNNKTDASEKPVKDIDVNFQMDQNQIAPPVDESNMQRLDSQFPDVRPSFEVAAGEYETPMAEEATDGQDLEEEYVPPGTYLNIEV